MSAATATSVKGAERETETEAFDDRRTKATKRRYDRMAALYDLFESPMERGAAALWRRDLWACVEGPKVLEIGVGTGKNLPYHRKGLQVTGIDLSPGMLARAREKAKNLGLKTELLLMDAQNLEFPDESFDAVVATFVFCSVPDPVRGLREAGRVCRKGGRIYLLEHMRAGTEWIGRLMDAANPIAVRLTGANINRRTMDNIRLAGLAVLEEKNLWYDVVKFVVCQPG